MRRRVGAVLLLAIVLLLLVFRTSIIRLSNEVIFDPGGRYDPRSLDYMGVIYSNRSDIYAYHNGYSTTTDCPWGFVHNGIDYHFKNNSLVIAAAPGYVEYVGWRINPDTTVNLYNIFVFVRFNVSVVLMYTFEPFTHVEGDHLRQLDMLLVKEGDWVQKGDPIGSFLHVEDGAHIHFGVTVNHEWVDPEPFFGDSDRLELLSLIHSYHPDWEISYP
ncbi:MAG: M23 family metallopeptidase [Candidatus Thorarchaeota archaeon]